jgi:peptide/nickel transport system permease protein
MFATQTLKRRPLLWLVGSKRRGGDFVLTVCIVYLLAVLFIAVFARILAPYGFNEQDLGARLLTPGRSSESGYHLLGTDELGRDIGTRLLFSIQTSLATALIGSIVGAIIGTALGVFAAHFRGIGSGLLVALMDLQASIPFMLFALAALAMFGNTLTLFVVLLGMYGWETYARLARGLVLASAGQKYVDALKSLGFSSSRLYLRHVIPNIAGALIVQLSINFPNIIILESGLSFLGVGIQPPLTSLGLMIGSGRNFLLTAWWLAVFPGIAIFATTLSVSVVGDWLRDRLDAGSKSL